MVSQKELKSFNPNESYIFFLVNIVELPEVGVSRQKGEKQYLGIT